MPVYEYECKTCNKERELVLPITNRSPQVCTECGTVLTRLISKSTFILKGQGWTAPSSDNVMQYTKGKEAKVCT